MPIVGLAVGGWGKPEATPAAAINFANSRRESSPIVYKRPSTPRTALNGVKQMAGPPFYLFAVSTDRAQRVYITDMTAGNRARVRTKFFWRVVGRKCFPGFRDESRVIRIHSLALTKKMQISDKR